MEPFAIVGFSIGVSALVTALANHERLKKLRDELDGLQKELRDLRSGPEA